MGIRTALGNLHPLSAVEALERERQQPKVVAAEPAPSDLQTLVAGFLNSAAQSRPSTTFEDHQT